MTLSQAKSIISKKKLIINYDISTTTKLPVLTGLNKYEIVRTDYILMMLSLNILMIILKNMILLLDTRILILVMRYW